MMLDQDRRSQPLDRLKAIPVTQTGILTLSGEIRFRTEETTPLDFGFGPVEDEAFVLGRAYLGADLRLSPDVRAYAELRTGAIWGEGRPASSLQDNRIDLHQAFLDLSVPTNGDRVTLRLGRQEILFGSGRMIGLRDGPNTRLSFDGIRGIWRTGNFRLDAFYAQPVTTSPGAFDDRSNGDFAIWGGHATLSLRQQHGLDLYYIGMDRPRVAFAKAVGAQRRHTFGLRWFGRSSAWDWDVEAAIQSGDIGTNKVAAFTVATDVGYTFSSASWKPRLGLRLNIASGDDNLSDRRISTFDVPFPKLPYFVEGGFVAPANIINLHFMTSVTPHPQFSMWADYVALWRHEPADAFYLPPLRPVAGTEGGGQFIAHLLQIGARWEPHPYVRIDLALVRGIASESLKAAGGETSDFFQSVLTLRF